MTRLTLNGHSEQFQLQSRKPRQQRRSDLLGLASRLLGLLLEQLFLRSIQGDQLDR